MRVLLIAWYWNVILILMIGVGALTVLAMVGLVVVVSVQTALPIVKGWLDINDWAAFSGLATAMGSIATLSAALIALRLGSRDMRARESDKLSEARAIELAIQEDLKSILPLVSPIASTITGMQRFPQTNPEEKIKLLNHVKEQAEQIYMPSLELLIDKVSKLDEDKRYAAIRVFSALPSFKRRCGNLRDVEQLGNQAASYREAGLQIEEGIKVIAYFSSKFLPDTDRSYWRGLKVWRDAYDPEERSFHDHPARR